jgi:hypothetical protein
MSPALPVLFCPGHRAESPESQVGFCQDHKAAAPKARVESGQGRKAGSLEAQAGSFRDHKGVSLERQAGVRLCSAAESRVAGFGFCLGQRVACREVSGSASGRPTEARADQLERERSGGRNWYLAGLC